jgi:signal transduction histidine kinase
MCRRTSSKVRGCVDAKILDGDGVMRVSCGPVGQRAGAGRRRRREERLLLAPRRRMRMLRRPRDVLRPDAEPVARMLRVGVIAALLLVTSAASAETPLEGFARAEAEQEARKAARQQDAVRQQAEFMRQHEQEESRRQAAGARIQAERAAALDKREADKARAHELSRSLDEELLPKPHTCATIHELESRMAADTADQVKAAYYDKIKRLRESWYAAVRLRASMMKKVGGVYTPEDLANLRQFDKQTVDALNDAKCLVPGHDTELDAESSEMHESLSAQAVDVEKCLATKGCMAKAYANDSLCPKLQQRAEILAEIAKLKKYGQISGAIDLDDLNDLGQQLRAVDDELADYTKGFRALTGTAFTKGMCK